MMASTLGRYLSVRFLRTIGGAAERLALDAQQRGVVALDELESTQLRDGTRAQTEADVR